MARPRHDNTPSTTPNKQRLSHFAVKNLKPRDRPYTVWDITQRGLAIVVQPSGHAAWKTIYSLHGRPRWLHLADATAIGLADARKLANGIMYQVAQGKDPAAERRAERSTGTFEELVASYTKYIQKKNCLDRSADLGERDTGISQRRFCLGTQGRDCRDHNQSVPRHRTQQDDESRACSV
jgi:Arm DNA-binding domain